MPHALTSNLLHCVFSTKERADSISDPQALGRYLGGVAREKKIPLLIAGGTNNHMHLLIALPAAVPLAKAIQDLKGNSLPTAKAVGFLIPSRRAGLPGEQFLFGRW